MNYVDIMIEYLFLAVLEPCRVGLLAEKSEHGYGEEMQTHFVQKMRLWTGFMRSSLFAHFARHQICVVDPCTRY